MTTLNKLLLAAALALAAFATPAAAEEALKLPDGKAAVHYFRADGAYDGWGLHVWQSFQKVEEADDEFAEKQSGDQPLKGVSWGNPLKQSGKDDFGVYWLLDASFFENGRVNYIIHLGNKKDQCNSDKFWLLKTSKEAWINAGDCNVYMTKEAAIKARK
jgi:hypothetical protein